MSWKYFSRIDPSSMSPLSSAAAGSAGTSGSGAAAASGSSPMFLQPQRLAWRKVTPCSTVEDSDAPQPSAHHTGAGAHVARTESTAAGGSGVVHEYDGTGVIQLAGGREPPNWREQQPDPEYSVGGHNANRGLPGQLGKRKSRKGKEHKNKKKEQRKEARATDRARQTMAELVRPYDA